ncbi:MAG: hypothetical protein LRY71_17350 [Bacillaceae bacterium]|nr:hypothetical protein [Bacillaceae bacterium]
MAITYQYMTTNELIEYYQRVKYYIEKGFRVEGLKDELKLISQTFEVKSSELGQEEVDAYLTEINHYLKSIRH